HGISLIAIQNGWQGLFSEKLIKKAHKLTLREIEPYRVRGGTVLGTSRFNPYEEKNVGNGVPQKIWENIQRLKLDGLISLGGDDTNGVTAKLYAQHPEFPFIGLPKTMDNDLNLPHISAQTYGFDTFAQRGAEALQWGIVDAKARRAILVVEVFGRNAGFVAMRIGKLVGATRTLIPEKRPIALNTVIGDLVNHHKKHGYAVLVVSEGVKININYGKNREILEAGFAKDPVARAIFKKGETDLDAFGHPKLEGVANIITAALKTHPQVIKNKIHVMQGGKIDYLFRSAPPSDYDMQMCARLGEAAVQQIMLGNKGRLLYVVRNSVKDIDITRKLGGRKIELRKVASHRREYAQANRGAASSTVNPAGNRSLVLLLPTAKKPHMNVIAASSSVRSLIGVKRSAMSDTQLNELMKMILTPGEEEVLRRFAHGDSIEKIANFLSRKNVAFVSGIRHLAQAALRYALTYRGIRFRVSKKDYVQRQLFDAGYKGKNFAVAEGIAKKQKLLVFENNSYVRALSEYLATRIPDHNKSKRFLMEELLELFLRGLEEYAETYPRWIGKWSKAAPLLPLSLIQEMDSANQLPLWVQEARDVIQFKPINPRERVYRAQFNPITPPAHQLWAIENSVAAIGVASTRLDTTRSARHTYSSRANPRSLDEWKEQIEPAASSSAVRMRTRPRPQKNAASLILKDDQLKVTREIIKTPYGWPAKVKVISAVAFRKRSGIPFVSASFIYDEYGDLAKLKLRRYKGVWRRDFEFEAHISAGRTMHFAYRKNGKAKIPYITIKDSKNGENRLLSDYVLMEYTRKPKSKTHAKVRARYVSHADSSNGSYVLHLTPLSRNHESEFNMSSSAVTGAFISRYLAHSGKLNGPPVSDLRISSSAANPQGLLVEKPVYHLTLNNHQPAGTQWSVRHYFGTYLTVLAALLEPNWKRLTEGKDAPLAAWKDIPLKDLKLNYSMSLTLSQELQEYTKSLRKIIKNQQIASQWGIPHWNGSRAVIEKAVSSKKLHQELALLLKPARLWTVDDVRSVHQNKEVTLATSLSTQLKKIWPAFAQFYDECWTLGKEKEFFWGAFCQKDFSKATTVSAEDKITAKAMLLGLVLVHFNRPLFADGPVALAGVSILTRQHKQKYFERTVDFRKFLNASGAKAGLSKDNHFTGLARDDVRCAQLVHEMARALEVFPNIVALLSMSSALAEADARKISIEEVVKAHAKKGNQKYVRWDRHGKIDFSVTPHIIVAALTDQRKAVIDDHHIPQRDPITQQDQRLKEEREWLYYHKRPLSHPKSLSNGFSRKRYPLERAKDVESHIILAKEHCKKAYGQEMRWIWNAEGNMNTKYADILTKHGISLGFLGYSPDGGGHFGTICKNNRLGFLRPSQPLMCKKMILCPYSADSKYVDFNGGGLRFLSKSGGDFFPWQNLPNGPSDESEAKRSTDDFTGCAKEGVDEEKMKERGLDYSWHVVTEFTDGENAIQNYFSGALIWLHKLAAARKVQDVMQLATAGEIINRVHSIAKQGKQVLAEIKNIPFGTWSHTTRLWIGGNETQWWLYYYMSKMIHDLETAGVPYWRHRKNTALVRVNAPREATDALWEKGVFLAEVSCYPWHLYPAGLFQDPLEYSTNYLVLIAEVYRKARELGFKLSPPAIDDDKVDSWVGADARWFVRLANEKFKGALEATQGNSASSALGERQGWKAFDIALPLGLLAFERTVAGRKEIEIENQSDSPSGDIYFTINGRKIHLNLAPRARKIFVLWPGQEQAYSQLSTYQLFGKIEKDPGNRKAFDALWLRASTEGAPLVAENKKDVIFLYRGDAKKVFLTGDMTGWDESKKIALKRLGTTDIFYVRQSFESDARFDYKFIVDGKYILDFINLRVSGGKFGENSLLVMPDFYEEEALSERSSLAYKGKLHEHVISSKFLRDAYKAIVYRPYGYDRSSKKRYPVVYFQEGMDYLRLAKAHVILDNLISSKKIPALIAVFVIAPAEAGENRVAGRFINKRYMHFFTEELLPIVEKEYRVLNEPSKRLIIGNVFGGLMALHLGLLYPRIFGNVASQTGYVSFNKDALGKLFTRTSAKNVSIYLDVGTYETAVSGLANNPDAHERNFLHAARAFKGVLDKKRYSNVYKEFSGGYSWGHWSNNLPGILQYFFPRGSATITHDKTTGTSTASSAASEFSPSIVDISKIALPAQQPTMRKHLLVVGALSNVMMEYYRDKLRSLVERYNVVLHAHDVMPERDAWERIKREDLPFQTYSRDYPRKSMDGLLVLTWPNSHFDFISRAVDQHIPVFVEKPIVLPGDLTKLKALHRNKNHIFAIDYFFDNPAILEAAQLISQGRLGKLKSIQGALLWNYPMEHGHGWLVDRRKSGGGLGMDLMTHLIAGIEQLLESQHKSFKDFQFDKAKVMQARYEGAPVGEETYTSVRGNIQGLPVDLRVGKGTGTDTHQIIIKGQRGHLRIDTGDKLNRPEIEFIPVSGVAWRKVYTQSDIGYCGLTRKILDSLQGLGIVTEQERGFRFKASMFAVQIVNNIQNAFSSGYHSYSFAREPRKTRSIQKTEHARVSRNVSSPASSADLYKEFNETFLRNAGPIDKASLNIFWSKIRHIGMPLVASNKTHVLFLWRGKARYVGFCGDMNGWNRSEPILLKRLGQTDVFYLKQQFKSDARLEYEFVVDGTPRQRDRLNPYKSPYIRDYEIVYHNELRMPNFKSAQELNERGVEGRRGVLSRKLEVKDAKTGYSLTVRVYTPHGYGRNTDIRYPVVYFQDGKEMLDKKLMNTKVTLDNLIADKKIKPVIAVFIYPPRDGVRTRDTEYEMNERYARFVVQTLVPFIDGTYRTRADASGRLIGSYCSG
ncbi:MAG: 6-phosphofructokinase, partial [Candidatus Omnitrophica bacterium]|nr:6-phosphofructokinase [Candidatus Omnitrophota bacterium]